MSISVDMARRVMEACKLRARELRSPVSIAIVDAGGHLVLFERMMAPYGWATGNISLAKANTAVMFNQSTDAVAQWGAGIPGFASSLAGMTDGKFIMAAGGWPIRVNGVTLGGVGVSGGNAPGRDDEIARAGIAVVEALGAPIPPQQQPYAPAPQPAVAYTPQAAPVYQKAESYQPANNGGEGYRPANNERNAPSQDEQQLSADDPYDAFREETATPDNQGRPGDQP